MTGEPPTSDYLLAEKLGQSVAWVNALDPDERIGWDAFLEVQGVLRDLQARTVANRP